MVTFSVMPSPKVSDTVVEPYNATLSVLPELAHEGSSLVSVVHQGVTLPPVPRDTLNYCTTRYLPPLLHTTDSTPSYLAPQQLSLLVGMPPELLYYTVLA